MARHVYVHVPFCSRRCSYCDFSIAVRREVPVSEYLTALDSELRTRFGQDESREVDTIYLGGGTPSRLGGEGVASMLETIFTRFEPTRDAEVTIEANPEDVSPAAVKQWTEAGVNRVSLGVQSFDNETLGWMHRTHDSAAIRSAVEVVRGEGIGNLSLDLIFALPAALRRNLESDLEKLVGLSPDHVALYGLTIEQRTPLGRWVARGTAVEQTDEGYEADYLLSHRLLTASGFEHYEVSNYARAGMRSRHNSSYWANVPYVGLGPSAHGFDGEVRRWNLRNYGEWSATTALGVDPIEGSERLDAGNRIAEAVYLGLRSDAGLPASPHDADLIGRWIDAGWVAAGPDARIRCTTTGWLRLDALAAALTHHRSR